MAAWRRAIELSLGDADVERLRSIAQSRTEPASRVERARILLAYREDPSFFAVGQALGLHHQTVQRCVERAVVEGPMAALDDRPRPGKEPVITIEAKAWLTSLACRTTIRSFTHGPTSSTRPHDIDSNFGNADLVASPCLHGLSFHQFAQLGRHAAAFVRCLALLAAKQPHRGVFAVPDRLHPFESAPREVEKEQR